jgi:hypothetical protein
MKTRLNFLYWMMRYNLQKYRGYLLIVLVMSLGAVLLTAPDLGHCEQVETVSNFARPAK